MNIERIMPIATSVIALFLLCACSEQEQKPIMKVYHGGHEYSVLERGYTEDSGEPAYFVRYLSRNPHSQTIRDAEFFDLYSTIANHVDTNKYQRVVLEAIDHRGRRFGIFKVREYRDSKSVQDVLKYRVKKKPPASDK